MAADSIKNDLKLFAKNAGPVSKQIKNQITHINWSENIVQKIRNVGDDILDVMEKAGGHTLERHVSKTNTALINRVAKNALIQNASSFINKRIAIKVVKESLKYHAEEIALWLNNLSLEQIILECSHSHSIGSIVPKGKKKPLYNLMKSRMVLKKDLTHELGFKIITAFPIL